MELIILILGMLIVCRIVYFKIVMFFYRLIGYLCKKISNEKNK